ncbi:MAG: anthranilate phosphoribosyltransferase [Propionivibrio sp.]|uniref:anthranilate phosphoribosyltransferase n=1 Tax=Propionivibrio sp. TaxID=2212460 RepID=UPI001A5D51FD|nr:anthranilate phosphoribosyltransferase [Propionivibrio sp.]MBL8414499.1 anthranilate phosphoribosyltransferase [Propionivibrio sp.]
MKPQDALTRVIEHREIFHDEMTSLMRQIMGGEVSPVMIAAIVIGLRVKKESIGEIAAAAQVMRELSTKVTVSNATHLVDTCGTGGDGAHTFNISTAAMFVAAAAGARIAKHGGRSVSSQSGSADVLEALGVNINLTPEQVGQCIDEVGIGFMFAPNHHSAMKHAAPVRRELGVRTLFNILGPLTNPANAANQVLGVFHPDLVGIQIRVLQRLGSLRALTVFGREGLDEISISGETLIGELKDGRVEEYAIHPEQFNLAVHDPKVLRVANVEESKAVLLAALGNTNGAARDIVALNAGASLYVGGLAATLADGVEQAFAAIASGAARAKLDAFAAFSQRISA